MGFYEKLKNVEKKNGHHGTRIIRTAGQKGSTAEIGKVSKKILQIFFHTQAQDCSWKTRTTGPRGRTPERCCADAHRMKTRHGSMPAESDPLDHKLLQPRKRTGVDEESYFSDRTGEEIEAQLTHATAPALRYAAVAAAVWPVAK